MSAVALLPDTQTAYPSFSLYFHSYCSSICSSPWAITVSLQTMPESHLIQPESLHLHLQKLQATYWQFLLLQESDKSVLRQWLLKYFNIQSSDTFFASPVSITVFSIPARFRAAIASFECGFTISEITICPAYFPLIARLLLKTSCPSS